MVKSCPVCKWTGIQMASEYLTKKSGIGWLGCVITFLMLRNCHSFVLPFEYRTLKSPVFRCSVFRWLLYNILLLLLCTFSSMFNSFWWAYSQYGSENRACLVFEWFKVGRFWNGLVFECHSKNERQPFENGHFSVRFSNAIQKLDN